MKILPLREPDHLRDEIVKFVLQVAKEKRPRHDEIQAIYLLWENEHA